jgi:hypothetical protein
MKMSRRNLLILVAFAGFLAGAACMTVGFSIYQLNRRGETGIVEVNAAEILTEAEKGALARPSVMEPIGAVVSLTEKPTEAHRYVLSIFDGYVTVFFAAENGKQEIMQKTSTPVSVLSEEEQHRLADGIKIVNDEQLARILQDYGS